MTEPLIQVHPGPPTPPASAGSTGLFSLRCLRYTVASGPDAARVPLAAADLSAIGAARLVGRTIADGEVLTWAVHPAFDDRARRVDDGYRSSRIALDIVTRDGRRLLDLEAAELDGTPSAPAARADVDIADQWNLRRVSLSALAGAVIAAVEVVIEPSPPGEAHGWIDGVRVGPERRPGMALSPSDRVPTTRGSHSSPSRSRGLTQPLTGVPHGGIHIAPATDLSQAHWTYTWNAHGRGPRPRLAGLLVSRSPSIWIGDRGALGLRLGLDVDADLGVTPEEFDHDDEHARPHLYRVRTLSGIEVAATATDHAAIAEVAFPRPGRIVLTSLGVPLTHVRVHEAGARLEVEATSTVPSPHESDPLPGFASVVVVGGRLQAAVRDGHVVIDVSPGDGPVRLEIGTSQLSMAQARLAGNAVAGRGLSEVAGEARARWDDLLDIVEAHGLGEVQGLGEAQGVADDDRVLLASDLYRMFLYPTRHDEDTPQGPAYPSPTKRSRPDFRHRSGREVRTGRMLTDNGFWDTYRTVWPAYALLAPARAGDLLDGMLEHVRDGGWSPRWTAGTPLDAMVGTSLDVIAADLVSAGVAGIDLDTAYAAALRNATTPSTDPRFGRKGMPQSLTHGFVSADVQESVSWTLEGAIADAGAAVLARELRRRQPAGSPRWRELQAEARLLAHRAGDYRSLWDAESMFFRPRDRRGVWADEPFDPRVWGGAHTETNAWTSRFGVPHDGAGLVDLFGGRTALRAALDAYFTTPETAAAEFAGSYGEIIHEMTEARDIRRGMWGVSNQPAHHIPWLYAHTDTPWRAGDIVRDAVDRLFRGVQIGQGYPGDEDNGEMSAWRLFGVLGWAPFAPGSGQLLILPPRHRRLSVRPKGAPPVEVRAVGGDDDRYIREVRWNGKPWTRPTIGISELHEGGIWEVELGDTPTLWSDPLDPRPYFVPDGVAGTRLRSIASGGQARVRRGEELVLTFEAVGLSADPPLLMLTLDRPGVHAFDVEALAGEGDDASAPVATQAIRDTKWAWAGQARPFEIDLPAGTRALRLRWRSGPATIIAAQVWGPEDR